MSSVPSGAEGAFAFIAEHTSDLIVRADAQGILTYVSPAVRRFGYEPADLVGLHQSALVHPEDAASLADKTVSLFSGENDPGMKRHHRYRGADGAWVWFEGNPQVVRGPDGEVLEIINIFRDVTARLALEAEARERASLFEAAFTHAAIGMAIVGLDGSFLRLNDAFCRICGYPEAEMLAMDFQRITHPDDLDADLDLLNQLIAGEIPSYRMDKRYIRADGEQAWVRLAVSMVRDADGKPKHFVSQVEDQSDRRAAEDALLESEARYRLIADNTSDMITMTDLTGRTTYASPSVRQLGVGPSELEGRSFAYSVHPDDSRAVSRAFRKLLAEGGTTRLRWRGHDANTGGWTWLESNASLLKDPKTSEVIGFLDVIRLIDLQVEQEEAVAQAHAQAEAAAAAKSQFLANMSHEIRTPLTAVLGFTNLLRDMELQDSAAGYVRRIAGAGNALLAIVNDILDFSKLEAGKFEIRPRPTRVAEVCEETLLLFSGQAEAKGLSTHFEAAPGLPKAVMMDADRLRQLLINLVGNAIKFTETGAITVRIAPTETGAVAIEVADTGPGLDDEAQALLFQRFTQIDGSMTRQHGGTGLGLAISRGIAEAMGGVIGVTSVPGEGATFRVELPAPAADLPEELAGEDVAMSIDGIRVLVVDDNPVNRELSRRILEAAGADVSDAGDGAEALAQLAQLPVDVVLMDLRMPVLDGRAALRALRNTPGPNQDVPVLAFTADADLEGDGDLDGFDGLVRKPIQPVDMYSAIAGATQWAPAENEDQSHVAG
ncbi:MAG: PAS domain S-box protein [Alphaproteobacteria bacterium]|nr:PAS domain S-box protein [Alphaproteobacteria bacterium]MBU1513167.1 PAS domain S-box protein [Alphaproteobacteria bacterium]MBU2095275.1 PAS domain S-box protein [Alphaproteobacteria bacterium]MBU2152190.1 PAS domain S-box protein [Alphaproteobacteria bacterium]MBU2306763.1 PAS domain S-box protein [Alphaproteobacteria bacterium]